MTAGQLSRASAADLPDPAAPAPATGARGRPSTGALRVLPAPEPAPRRAPFAILLALLLGGGLGGLLLLNTQLQQGSFVLAGLEAKESGLSDTAQMLGQQADALQAPQALQSAAAALGMVPAVSPSFLDLGRASARPAPGITAVPRPVSAAERARARAIAAERAAQEARARAAIAKAEAAKAAKAAKAAESAKAAGTAPAPRPSGAAR